MKNEPIAKLCLMKKIFDYYLAEQTSVVGAVTIGKDTNIWPFSCIRGDVAPITIGARCSIQEHSVLHCQHKVPLEIENDVIIGHRACVHCAFIGSGALIGIGAIVLDRCRIGKQCIVAAGAVVLPDAVVPDGSVVAGVPAKVIRAVTDADTAYIKDVTTRYVTLSQDHAEGKFPSIAP